MCVLMAPQATEERVKERGRGREKVHGIIKYSFMAYERQNKRKPRGGRGRGQGQVERKEVERKEVESCSYSRA